MCACVYAYTHTDACNCTVSAWCNICPQCTMTGDDDDDGGDDDDVDGDDDANGDDDDDGVHVYIHGDRVHVYIVQSSVERVVSSACEIIV